MAFLPEDHALAIAAMSYNGKLDFGLLGDYDAMPDLEEFAGHLADSLDELVAAAKAASPPPKAKAKAKPKPKPSQTKRRSSNGRKSPGRPTKASNRRPAKSRKKPAGA